MSGARVGAAFGAVGGPVGMAVGGLAGAHLLGGLLERYSGTVAGNQLGDVVDAHYLGNWCLDCGNVFRSSSRS